MTKTGTILLTSILAAIVAGSEMSGGAPFQFTPTPRWREEPETEALCAAIHKECPALSGKNDIDAEIGFDEIYDASGNLVGLRLTKSTGCKPLDESSLLGHRHFRLAFHRDGKPDLDDIHAEVAPGVNPDSVWIVKRDGTTLSLGCN